MIISLFYEVGICSEEGGVMQEEFENRNLGDKISLDPFKLAKKVEEEGMREINDVDGIKSDDEDTPTFLENAYRVW